MRFNHPSIVLLMGLFMMAVPWNGVAQSPVLLHVSSNDSDAAVYADSEYLGVVHESPFWINSETNTIQLATLQAASWSILPIQMSLEEEVDDTVFARLNFPMYHQIESHPLSAKVWLGNTTERRLLGVTPMVFSTYGLRDSTFQVELDGYSPESIQPKMEIWNRYMTSLIPLDQNISISTVNSVTGPKRKWIDWSIAVVGFAAGVAAVHYKFRADRINDDYLETGDPALRPRVARLDDYSGIALGVMQAGVVTLAIRFALR